MKYKGKQLTFETLKKSRPLFIAVLKKFSSELKMAKHFDVSPMQLSKVRNGFGLTCGRTNKRPNGSKNEARIKDLIKKNYTLKEMVDELGIHETTIYRWIPKLYLKEKAKKSRFELKKNRIIKIQMLLEQNKSFNLLDIANELKMGLSSLRNFLSQNQIKLR